MAHAGTLVLLNGTSSSGKSTILKAFQEQHPDFKVFKIDDWHHNEMVTKARQLGWEEEHGEHPSLFLTRYVEQQTGRPNFDTQTRAHLFRDAPTMYTGAKKALESGSNVIMDTVFEYDPEYERFSDFFDCYEVIKALVYCRLDVLLDRVHERNKSGIPAELRTAFLSFEQFPAMYKLQEHPDELVVDSVSSVSMKTALATAIKDLIDAHIHDRFIPALDSFKLDFTKRFELDTRNDIKLVARHTYDLVLDSSSKTPEELAQALEIVLGRKQ